MSIIRKAAIAAGLGSLAVAGVAAPAQAHDRAGLAIGAGILGLGIGAAIASSHPHYVYEGYYAPPPPPPPPRVVYEGAYYAPPPPPPYGYVERCRVVTRWDPYWGGYVRHRRCF